MTDEQIAIEQEQLQELAKSFPGKDEYEIYLLDNIERILTNSRDQTKYLRNISTIITVLVVLAVLGWFITLIFG